MPPVIFQATIKITGVNPYVPVSASRARKLKPQWKKPMPVLFRINGMPEKFWRINMMPKGDGSFYLYLHGGVRKGSKTKVGDRVEVEIEFDREYRNGPMHPMPTWFRSGLQKNPAAKKAWDGLIPSRKKEILRYFANLRSAEAKARNLARALNALSGSKVRFMGRTWE
ncbi:MAG: YdeI/OmpD-associated family protein [Bacteroidota bacterium]|nr:YdeI/OmpD-associated family protein [Bacteroidota bacterium]MDP4237054.1 YdeI/OmpD-associated family protein [Bacteroidota bacterium]